MKFRAIGLCLLASLMHGCGEAKLDGSSEAAMKASVEKVMASLDASQQKDFKSAFQTVAFSHLDLKGVLSGAQDKEAIQSDMYKALDGKTAAEVIAAADKIKADRYERERAQALVEIAELERQQASAIAAAEKLNDFKVERSRFYISEGQYEFQRKPVVELVVNNGTPSAISRAYFIGTIASPGRSVPWLVEDFNYQISGGLEPGEAAKWYLSPNMFSAWGKVNAPDDAVFTVEVVRLDGADGEPLYDSRGLSESQQARLTKLKAEYQ